MSQVFISYARPEAEHAQQIAEILRGLGFSVWRDDQLPAHRAYADVIEERLHGAKAVVVLWSQTSVKSQWVRAEAEVARQAGRLVQVVLDDAALPLPFSQIQCADLRGWTDDRHAPGVGKIVESVTALVRAAAAAEPIKPVDLAREPDFRLGGLTVSPSAGRVTSAAGERKVEPRVMEVLVVLASHPGRTVTRDELIEACWGGRIVSDDAVNRVIAQVRALARAHEPAPFVLETVPKVGVRLVPGQSGVEAEHDGSAGAAPPSLAKAGSAAPGSPPRRFGPRAWAVAAGVLVLLATAGVLAWRFLPTRPARPPGQNGHVDVMAFEPRTPDPVLTKVGQDLSGSLIRLLSNSGTMVTLQPVRRDAAGGDAELRVAGTIERQGDSIMVNSQILERQSGNVLLSHRHERPAREAVTAANSIAQDIALTLHCALKDRETARKPLSSEAFALYLNACATVFEGAPAGRMLALARQLIKAAPEFAGAHAIHAMAAAKAAYEADTPAEAQALHREAEAAARLALKINPRTAKAYSALAVNAGALSMRPSDKWLQQEQFVTKALSIEPDLPPALNEYFFFLRGVGRIREALALLRSINATEDPRNGFGLDSRVTMLRAAQGDLAGAEQELQAQERLNGTPDPSMRWTIAFWWEDPRTALRKLRPLMTAAGEEPGKIDCFEQYLTSLQVGRPKGLPAACRAYPDANWDLRMLAREGDLDGAYARDASHVAPVSLYYPEMRAFRADPRFWPLAKRVGLVDYWQTSGHWPDFCSERGLPYDCKAAARGVAASRPRT